MNLATTTDQQRIFSGLLIYRWLSLIPPLAVLLFNSGARDALPRHVLALSLAVATTTAITLFARRLNRRLRRQPALLLLDLLLAGFLLALTGGWQSPYYLYALSPLLVAGLFFHVRGAIVATTVLLLLYLAAIAAGRYLFEDPPAQWLVVLTAVIGGYLISVTLGYASMLLARLQLAQETLGNRLRDLHVLHDLGTTLQHAVDLENVLAMVLAAITNTLDFRRAVVALVDPESETLAVWLAQNHGQETAVLLDQRLLSLSDTDNPLVSALHHSTMSRQDLSAQFGIANALVLPMRWGARPIGLFLIDVQGHEQNGSQLEALEAISRQAAVTVGMMQTRLQRAKESAVQEERTRLALDLHDTVSQSLFGLVYTLDACLKLLAEDPQAIGPELQWALNTAEEVRRTIRATVRDLWPDELTADQFAADLQIYASDVLQATELDLTFDVRGDFSALSPPVRRSMYRICQEALTNVVHHAGARESRICVDVADGRARFIVRDNGRGFDPQTILSQSYSADHFGLRGMRERAVALGGTCYIYSQPDAGTSIVIDIPANIQEHHAPAPTAGL